MWGNYVWGIISGGLISGGLYPGYLILILIHISVVGREKHLNFRDYYMWPQRTQTKTSSVQLPYIAFNEII